MPRVREIPKLSLENTEYLAIIKVSLAIIDDPTQEQKFLRIRFDIAESTDDKPVTLGKFWFDLLHPEYSMFSVSHLIFENAEKSVVDGHSRMIGCGNPLLRPISKNSLVQLPVVVDHRLPIHFSADLEEKYKFQSGKDITIRLNKQALSPKFWTLKTPEDMDGKTIYNAMAFRHSEPPEYETRGQVVERSLDLNLLYFDLSDACTTFRV